MFNKNKHAFSYMALLTALISFGLMLYPKAIVDVKMINPNETVQVYHSYIDQIVYWRISIFPRYAVIFSLIYIVSYIIYILVRKKRGSIVLFVISTGVNIACIYCAIMSSEIWTDNQIKYFIIAGLCISIACVHIDKIINKLY